MTLKDLIRTLKSYESEYGDSDVVVCDENEDITQAVECAGIDTDTNDIYIYV